MRVRTFLHALNDGTKRTNPGMAMIRTMESPSFRGAQMDTIVLGFLQLATDAVFPRKHRIREPNLHEQTPFDGYVS